MIYECLRCGFVAKQKRTSSKSFKSKNICPPTLEPISIKMKSKLTIIYIVVQNRSKVLQICSKMLQNCSKMLQMTPFRLLHPVWPRCSILLHF